MQFCKTMVVYATLIGIIVPSIPLQLQSPHMASHAGIYVTPQSMHRSGPRAPARGVQCMCSLLFLMSYGLALMRHAGLEGFEDSLAHIVPLLTMTWSFHCKS